MKGGQLALSSYQLSYCMSGHLTSPTQGSATQLSTGGHFMGLGDNKCYAKDTSNRLCPARSAKGTVPKGWGDRDLAAARSFFINSFAIVKPSGSWISGFGSGVKHEAYVFGVFQASPYVR